MGGVTGIPFSNSPAKENENPGCCPINLDGSKDLVLEISRNSKESQRIPKNPKESQGILRKGISSSITRS